MFKPMEAGPCFADLESCEAIVRYLRSYGHEFVVRVDPAPVCAWDTEAEGHTVRVIPRPFVRDVHGEWFVLHHKSDVDYFIADRARHVLSEPVALAA